MSTSLMRNRYLISNLHNTSEWGCCLHPWQLHVMNTIHYTDVIMGTIASQIASLTIVYSTVYSVADQRKYQSSASLAFVRGIHRRPVKSPHKWPVTRKMFPFDDVIMFGKLAKCSVTRRTSANMILVYDTSTKPINLDKPGQSRRT